MKLLRMSFVMLFITVFVMLFSKDIYADPVTYCDLSSYRVASASDVMFIDLSGEECTVVGNDIREFENLIYLNIMGKQLEDQSILSAFPFLMELNAEHSNLNTLEYIGDMVDTLYISYSDVTDIRGVDRLGLIDYNFDYLPLNEESINYLNDNGYVYRQIPKILGVYVNDMYYQTSITNILTTKHTNEVRIEYEGEDDFILKVIDDNSNGIVAEVDGKYYLDSNTLYRIIYGKSGEYEATYILRFQYVDVPVITIPVVRVEEPEESNNNEPEELVEDLDIEDIPKEIIEEEVEEIVFEETQDETPIIKDTADQGWLITIMWYIRKLLEGIIVML